MKAWCSRNMGSLAEPWTEDIEPFMKTCRALCMVLIPGTAMPVCGLANPAGNRTTRCVTRGKVKTIMTEVLAKRCKERKVSLEI